MADEYLDSRDRLLYVISLSGLTGKEFAARVNVSPSTISQITSTSEKSRKTGLTEMVVNKILSAFPQFNLSYEWLLNGIGPKTIQSRQPSLFDQRSHESKTEALPMKNLQYEQVSDNFITLGKINEAENGRTEVNFTQADMADSTSHGKTGGQQGDVNPSDTISGGGTAGADIGSGLLGGHGIPIPPKGATIERIVILYSDGTFTDYLPRVKK